MYHYSEKEQEKMKAAEQTQDINRKYGVSYCTLKEEEYPSGLRKIAGRPSVIYFRGNIKIINCQKNVAVIGARKSSTAGMRLSYETGMAVGRSGLNLVNGLALGCDTEAIRGALAAGGRCVVILPCGLDNIQPKQNQKLAEAIIGAGGCLLSEYPVGTVPQKYRYVERDRLQSGISQGVLIVEAEENSGTMHTADFASRQYRRLACYHHRMLEFSSGNRSLEMAGKAQVLKTDKDLQAFLQNVIKEDTYEQLSFKL